jgi:uncharacterized protein YbbC (DUF1343 family)
MAGVTTGLDRLSQQEAQVLALVRGRRVGLLAHPASVDARLVSAEAIVRAVGGKLCALFGPEHGYLGQAQDMIGVGEERAGAVPVYSMYGQTFAELSPRPEWLRDLDVVIIDLQDVGSRYYTFVWSAALMLLACAKQGVSCVVLDRPNPLGGTVMEGAPQRPGYRSFVGLYDVPVRHGLTLGEVCALVAEREKLAREALTVVRMLGYQREMLWSDTGLPWVLPSPNMPTPETALVYPGGCLLEGTNLSEGRGTTRPFEIWGAPFVSGEALAAKVHAPGAVLRPLSFEPTFHKHGRTLCGGVQVHVANARTLRSYALYQQLIAEAAWASDAFAFRTEPYEYVADRPAMDLLTGGPEYREAVEARADLRELWQRDQQGVAEFAESRRAFLLYPD